MSRVTIILIVIIVSAILMALVSGCTSTNTPEQSNVPVTTKAPLSQTGFVWWGGKGIAVMRYNGATATGLNYYIDGVQQTTDVTALKNNSILIWTENSVGNKPPVKITPLKTGTVLVVKSSSGETVATYTVK